jgi:hypothetical protein
VTVYRNKLYPANDMALFVSQSDREQPSFCCYAVIFGSGAVAIAEKLELSEELPSA